MTATTAQTGTAIDSALDHLSSAEELLESNTGSPEQTAIAHAAIAQSLAITSIAASIRAIAEAFGSVIAPATRYPVKGATEHAAIRFTSDRQS